MTRPLPAASPANAEARRPPRCGPSAPGSADDSDLPMPEDWRACLAGLAPHPFEWAPRPMPDLDAALDRAIVALPQPHRSVMEQRVHGGRTIGQVTCVTRHRARLLEQETFRLIESRWPRMLAPLRTWFEPERRPWLRLFSLPDPRATTARVTQLYISRLCRTELRLASVGQDLWIMESKPDFVATHARLRELLCSNPDLIDGESLRASLRLDPDGFQAVCARFGDQLYRTVDGRFGWRATGALPLLHAMLETLTRNGFPE